ncbi:DUF11 domain-containing protein [Sphingomonas sp. G-3-2-10]|uniref:DUF11 domain-containing protein n=1 Tax=Sphingomonas sp. G-3-2-10 TaxID=2728838 RepID=UPI00146CBDE1|nr:DUF11 domain-containing protein [Sphingomonas sp. G-3-2-10]NML05163.1 DUF11 domain-containing protein [Sphingomonas sp. G-3-2-10]
MPAYLKSGGAVALLAIAVPALAVGNPVSISSRVLAEVRKSAADGTTRVELAAPGRVTPGDRVVYQITVRNSGSQAARDLVIANPVPAQLAYAGPAQGSPAPELSIDGQRFAPIAQLTVRTANGQSRAATLADVHIVRWRIASVPAGGSANVSFRATLK